MRSARRKKKVLQVAFDVLALVANFNPFAARADEVFKARVQVQGLAHLVKIRDLNFGALAHFPAVRANFPQDQLEQCGFARAIGAHQAHFVATQQGGAEISHHGFALAIGAGEPLAHTFQFSDDFSAGCAAGQAHVHPALYFTALGALLAQLLQPHNATLAAGAARFHPFAHPYLLFSQQLIGPRLDHGLLCQLHLFLLLICRVITGVRQQATPVKLNNARGHFVQKAAVVGDDDHAGARLNQQVF